MTQHITFVIRQPGTANAFIPLIKELHRYEDVTITILAFDLSAVLLEAQGLAFHQIDNFADAVNYLTPDIDYLVTGTSEKVADDELFWQWASDNNIASLAFVDQWSNLAQRFECQHLPDHVAVLDEQAKKTLEPLLQKRCRIYITGSPVFDALRNSIHSSVGPENEISVLFALEPDISGMSEAEIRAQHGFTEYDCLRAGFKAACETARNKQVTLRFILKLHPRDEQKRIEDLLRKLSADVPGYPIEVWEGSKEEALMASSIVMGIRSMLLLEAAFVNKPVISIQLHRKTTCPLTDDRNNIRLAFTERELERSLDDCITTPITPVNDADIQGFSAIDRFIEILRS